MKSKKIGYALIGISAIPILIYPVILLANAMSLAGHRDSSTTFLDLLPARFFIFTTTIYPVVVIISYGLFKKNYRMVFAFLPYLNLLLILIAFMIWSIASG